ncbi:hypothetical protein KVV02_007415 [Mortierella alpina]|uniref:Uncharacterized protein n=1 Tax=Mortierella alpina TaxID=64518 RepID=A0A9P8A420_MORAP|nr:hypothetical protein KVV02_007415 [Mortierella alpina]
MPTQFVTNLTKDNAHEDGIWCAAWSAKNALVTGSLDNTVKVWYVEYGRTLSEHLWRSSAARVRLKR